LDNLLQTVGIMVRKTGILIGFLAVLAGGAALAQSQSGTPAAEGAVSPARWQAHCEDRHARMIGHLSYLEARLNLTPAQKPLFDRWRTSVTAGADQGLATCRDNKAGQTQSLPDRSAQMQKMLAQRLHMMEASQPALVALNEALTAEQRTLLAQGFGPGEGRSMGGWHHGGMGPGAGAGMGPGSGMGGGMGPGSGHGAGCPEGMMGH
jgi:hypothetical protein